MSNEEQIRRRLAAKRGDVSSAIYKNKACADCGRAWDNGVGHEHCNDMRSIERKMRREVH